MPRNITIYFSDGTAHQYNGAPDNVTPDDIEKRAKRDYPNKKITRIDGGSKTSNWSDNNNQQNSTSKSTQKKIEGTIFENNDWLVKLTPDPMTDKVEATIFSKDKPRFIQGSINPDVLYISYKGRGGLQFLKYRIDNNQPVEKFFGQSNSGVFTLGYNEIMQASRLRIQAFTVLENVVNDDINLSSFNEAVSQAKKHI